MTLSSVQLILAQRLALGEITEEEHDRVLAKISGGDQARPAAVDARDVPATAFVPSQEIPLDNSVVSTGVPPVKRGLIGRLWRGEALLEMTFWGGILTIIALLMIATLVGEATGHGSLFNLFMVGVLGVDMFFAVAMYRSGQAYRWSGGVGIFGRVAQLTSVLLIMINLLIIIRMLQPRI